MKMPRITNEQYIHSLAREQLAEVIECPYNQDCWKSGKSFATCGDCVVDWLGRTYESPYDDSEEDE